MVVLPPGEAASAGFVITSYDNLGGRICPTATSIRVRLPDVAASFSVDVAVRVIGILFCNPPGAAYISPIVKGALLAVSPEFTVPTTTLPTVVLQYKPGPVVPVPSAALHRGRAARGGCFEWTIRHHGHRPGHHHDFIVGSVQALRLPDSAIRFPTSSCRHDGPTQRCRGTPGVSATSGRGDRDTSVLPCPVGDGARQSEVRRDELPHRRRARQYSERPGVSRRDRREPNGVVRLRPSASDTFRAGEHP